MHVMGEYFQGLLANYGQFFSWNAFYAVISDPVSWGTIFWLILLEGLLSCDNALVLAVVAGRLPGKQQKKALLYGIWGAYFFRFLAIGLGTYLIKFKWIQIIGAGYLLWMSAKYFFSGDEEAEDGGSPGAGKECFWDTFWGTVITVELMDISFSVDSITAAFALSGKAWVLFIGGMLGILMMRGVASVFVILIEKYPALDSAAYVLIALIGFKLLGQTFNFYLPQVAFFFLMAAVLLGTIVIHHIREG